jgi:xylulose-5-phosphate/fructose-6-phosphate phosphoketolase
LDKAIEDIKEHQHNARENNDSTRPRWPMIVLKSPKGWTGHELCPYIVENQCFYFVKK